MKTPFNRLLTVVVAAVLLNGCSGEKESQSHVSNELEQIKLSEKKLYGAWKSADGSYGFEFHASPTEEGTIDPDFEVAEEHLQKEGIIYQDGRKSGYFNWRVLADGSVQLDIRDSVCQSRPLVLCAREAVERIEVNGSNPSNLTFKATRDEDLDGVFDSNYEWHLSQQKLPPIEVGHKSYILQSNARSESQIYASNDSGELRLYRPANAGDHEFVETQRSDYLIEFSQTHQVAEPFYFYVYNHGYERFNVKAQYEYLVMYPSFDGELIVSFAYKNTLETDADVSLSDVDFEDFIEDVKFSHKGSVRSVGNDVPTIEFGKEYYSWFVDAVEKPGLVDVSANLLVFHDANRASISARNVLTHETESHAEFQWSFGEHQEIILENDKKRVTIEFVAAEGDRYRILTSVYDVQHHSYISKAYLDYLFAQNALIDVSQLLPRRFEFVNSNGVTVSPVRLLENGEVMLGNVDSADGGRWFFHDNLNEVVRYECTALGGALMEDYQQCLDSFEVAGTADATTTYSHVSHLKFLNKFGDTYLVQYDATFWGGRFEDDFVNTISGYYLWTHLP